METLHIKTEKGGKWPQINQVLVIFERKIKWAVSGNKEKFITQYSSYIKILHSKSRTEYLSQYKLKWNAIHSVARNIFVWGNFIFGLRLQTHFSLTKSFQNNPNIYLVLYLKLNSQQGQNQ